MGFIIKNDQNLYTAFWRQKLVCVQNTSIPCENRDFYLDNLRMELWGFVVT